MRKLLPLLFVLFLINNVSFSQNRGVTRGAEPGELYISSHWYFLYSQSGFDSCAYSALFRLTENGKKLTVQSSVDMINEYNPPTTIGSFNCILADAAPGVVYTRNYYGKGSYIYTSFWTSFDYGKNWIFREENKGQHHYYSANIEGLVYRGRAESTDYGESFPILKFGSFRDEPGLKYGEAFIVGTSAPYKGQLWHTFDFYETYSTIPIGNTTNGINNAIVRSTCAYKYIFSDPFWNEI